MDAGAIFGELKRRRVFRALVGCGVAAFAAPLIWYFAIRPARRAPVEASIAVLPFADMSPGGDQGYFSDGVSEQILDNLAQVDGLKVIGRTSSFSFKGKPDDLRTIAGKLGVATLLEGSVRKSGDRIRITAQLIGASDGSHLWSDTYDRNLNDIFAVQDDIARSIVEALKVKLLAGSRSGPRPPANPEAYRLYLLGREQLLFMSTDGLQRGDALLRKSVEADPSYAPAWVMIADSLGDRALSGKGAVVAQSEREAMDAANRAIQLDPDYVGGYGVRGWLRSNRWDWEGADEDMRKARALGPNQLFLLVYDSIVQERVGRLKEAISLQRRALELEPVSGFTWSNLGGYLLEDGQYDEARAAIRKALEISPDNPVAARDLATIDLLQGDAAKALAAFEKLPRDFGPDAGEQLVRLSMAQHDLKHDIESDQLLDRLVQQGDDFYRVAAVHAWRGELDQAFRSLDRAYDARDQGLRLVKVDPLLRNLHADPRFAALLAKMKFPND